jgi:small subunit ribosomal protein S7e
MSTFMRKLHKVNGEPTAFEQEVAQILYNIEVAGTDLSAELKELYINRATSMETSTGERVATLYVPFPLLVSFHKIHDRLVREVEKKLQNTTVVIIADRKIEAEPARRVHGGRQVRARSRTLTNVHAATLDDIAYPVNIAGKRTRYLQDGSRLLKVLLPLGNKADCETRLAAYSFVYEKITGTRVAFTFADF